MQRATLLCIIGVLPCLVVKNLYADSSPLPLLTLDKALYHAKSHDRWFEGNRLAQEAKEQQAIAASALPDPEVAIRVMNLPIDSWDLDQDPMTQIALTISQRFPRGKTLALQNQKLRIEASTYPLLQEDREAKIAHIVSNLWLDAFAAQYTIQLIQNDRTLFEQLVEIAKANYANTIGKTRQHDVIRAQLEIAQLEDRITLEENNLAIAKARLQEWLYKPQQPGVDGGTDFDTTTYRLPATLPQITLAETNTHTRLSEILQNHPTVRALDVRSRAAKSDVALASQMYEPQWNVNVSYGLREKNVQTQERSDVISFGVGFDLPIFTSNKQDPNLKAATKNVAIIQSNRYLLIKKMASALNAYKKQLVYLKQRQKLYQTRLLKQTHDQAEAAITAYTNDDGDFSEVVRARIAEMNTRIQARQIDIEILKTFVNSNYLLTQSKVELDHE